MTITLTRVSFFLSFGPFLPFFRIALSFSGIGRFFFRRQLSFSSFPGKAFSSLKKRSLFARNPKSPFQKTTLLFQFSRKGFFTLEETIFICSESPASFSTNVPSSLSVSPNRFLPFFRTNRLRPGEAEPTLFLGKPLLPPPLLPVKKRKGADRSAPETSRPYPDPADGCAFLSS